jgi:hypothetical protein
MVRVTPVSWLLSLPPDAQQSACSISQGGSAARLGRRVPSSCEAGSTSLAKALHYPSASRESCSISLATSDSKRSANHNGEKSHRKRPDFPQREASVRCRNVPGVAALTLGRLSGVRRRALHHGVVRSRAAPSQAPKCAERSSESRKCGEREEARSHVRQGFTWDLCVILLRAAFAKRHYVSYRRIAWGKMRQTRPESRHRE